MIMINYIFELQLGGIEELIKNYSIAMVRNGHKAVLLSNTIDNTQQVKTKYLDAFEKHGIDYICLNKKKGKERIRAVLRIRKILKELNPDVIIIHLEKLTPFILLASIGLRIPKIQVVHNEHTTADKAHRFLFKYFISRYVAVSTPVRNNIVHSFSLKDRHVALIHNGVDVRAFREIKREYGNVRNVYCVGRLTKQKNQVELIEIYELFIRKCIKYKMDIPKLHIVGKGELEEDIINRVDELKYVLKEMSIDNPVSLDGVRSDVVAMYRECDLLVLPSLWEGLPLVIIEAMSAGIPCICYNAGGLSEIINHPANGILIESKNKEKFAQKLVELCENSALRESTGKRAREDAQSFSMERCADRYIDLIKKIIDKQ